MISRLENGELDKIPGAYAKVCQFDSPFGLMYAVREVKKHNERRIMNWKNIPHRPFVGGYIDLLNEGMSNVPNNPRASVKSYLRGRIKFVSSLHNLPAFRISSVKSFDKHLRRWKSFIAKSTFTLRLADFNQHNGLLRPVQLENGILLMNTLNGVTALIYPSGTKPPKKSPFAEKGRSREIIDLLKYGQN